LPIGSSVFGERSNDETPAATPDTSNLATPAIVISLSSVSLGLIWFCIITYIHSWNTFSEQVCCTASNIIRETIPIMSVYHV